MKNEDILKMIDSNPMEIRDPHYTFEGIPVPRVTEILSFIDMADLLGWANYMGLVKHKRYADIMTEASNIGTAAHSNIEKFFSEDQKDKVDKDNISFQAFMVWWNKLNMNHKVSILGQEEKLVCPYFGGTYDMLVSIDNKVYLIDFKTSNHVGYKYFLQLAAYRYMLYINKGISINGCLVLQLSKVKPEYNEYLLDFENQEEYQFIEACTRAFFSLVYLYYNIYTVKRGFNKLF